MVQNVFLKRKSVVNLSNRVKDFIILSSFNFSFDVINFLVFCYILFECYLLCDSSVIYFLHYLKII